MAGKNTAVSELNDNIRFHITSRRWLLQVGAIVVGALILLSWLYIKAEAVSPLEFISYTQQLRTLREANAQLDGEVLAARMELSRNYDALTAYTQKTVSTGAAITTPSKFLLEADRIEIEGRANILNETLKSKARLVDIFKRHNAILRNSLSFYQRSADDFLDTSPKPTLAFRLESYVRHMMFFVRTPDQKHRDMLREAQHKLSLIQIEPSDRPTIDNLVLHGELIKTYISKVEQQMRKILRLPVSQQQDKLATIYSNGHTNAQRVAQQYRNLLYLIAVLLTAYLAYTFIRLEITRRSLAKAHSEVTERYLAQKRAEELLRLHDTAFNSAHEGITLTDADGTIMAVNPAFSRITGYERDEVIGRNPRVLKSGRHDDEFYKAMWKSIVDTGNWRGEIWNRNKFGEVYPELLSITTVSNAENEVTNYVAVFADISRQKEQEHQLRQMAYYDALTDLPNRVLLTDRMIQSMSQTVRSNSVMAVCYLDLDGFKPINDTYGHEAGDRLLIEVANRFKDALRGGDTVARLGGDEFVFLILGLESNEEYEQAVNRLMNGIAQQITVNGNPMTISASIGVTLYPHDNSDADTLLRHADQAMYQAKQKGKDCFHLFDPEQDNLARSHHERISRLESALNAGELILYYQPKVDMRQGEVIGLEALIRWQHPERGLVPPLEFLPAIEEHKLIVQIGKWVINTALTHLEIWQSQGLDITVSVNVASRQLQCPNFVEDLKNALASHPTIDASKLELEVLETAALEDIVSVSQIIEDCREFGISFALDDFGTGYSSLTYLKRLPASTLKIDQSFVRDMLKDPENLAIVQGILGLTTAFQRNAIAEGVESIDHGRMLMQLGCDFAQGYGIARPMPFDDVLEWINSWQPDPEWQSISNLYWEDADYPMLSAEVEHQRWITLLIHSVNSGQPVIHKNVSNHHKCRFGQWFYSNGNQRYGDTPSFQQIEVPHERVHKIAGEIDRYCRDGQISQAKELIPELLAQRDKILKSLKELSMAVASNHSFPSNKSKPSQSKDA
ncbi:MAG: EAL domain-containing protein [Gammaproteobacteria bacterium]|nr:EAL domain-containing protein [Gammaproteobacteria bacterium]